AEEFLAEYTADRVETTASVWLAQTFNCARCHDHKYDPISQKDFYALKAFFHNVNEKGVGNYGAPTRVSSPPFLKLPAPTIEARIASLQSEIRSTEAQIAALSKTASDTLDAWTLKIRESSVSWTPLAWNSATAGKAPLPIHGEPHAARLEPTGARGETLKLKLQLPPVPPSALRIEVATEGPAASLSLSSIKAFLSPKTTAPTRTPLPLRGSAEGLSLSAADATKVADAAPKEQVPLAPKPDAPAAAVFELSLPESAQHGGELELEIALRSGATAPTLWRVLATGADRELLVPDSLRSLASKEAAKRTPKETQQLADFQLRQRDDHRQLSSTLAELQKKLKSYEGEVPTTLVMEELPTPRPTFVLMRGAYDKPGEQVTAATPGVLPPMAAEWPKNRLGLARWLVDPANPLPARVTVNRFWQSVFGTGLVASSGDFGAQGELPSHPELLDWLAQEFIRSGWDVKALLRLLVTSATYRQSSALSPILLERDPANRLLARGPRFRLQSEWVRDQALHAAGLLVDKIGGPSVKPYHPPGVYEQVTAGGYDRYVQDTGESLYRRSLYTYWKRSVPHPAMLVFDAPFRETCTVKRTRTNTPLQALNLMNDPTYVEAARGIAERMMQEALPQPEARLSHGFKLLLCRQPTPAELAILQKALLRHRADFEADPASAKAFVSIGSHKAPENLPVHELAAYTAVACSVLHSDEWINKE
ncbi:MAG: hypothetical protein RLZZ244_2956, partial [Verrucomicrobiota bacterium]